MTKYCRTCGTKMDKVLKPVNQYDEDTGKREVVLEFSCKKWRIWRIGHYPTVVNTNSHLRDIGANDDD